MFNWLTSGHRRSNGEADANGALPPGTHAAGLDSPGGGLGVDLDGFYPLVNSHIAIENDHL